VVYDDAPGSGHVELTVTGSAAAAWWIPLRGRSDLAWNVAGDFCRMLASAIGGRRYHHAGTSG
jgi:hypothetical protein